MSMIKWVVTTSAIYQTLQPKENNALYFLSDTQEIFKGDKSFTQATQLVDTFPTNPAQGRIYIDQTTLEGKVWANGTWKTVIEPVAKTLNDQTTEEKAVSGEAIKRYVTEKVTDAVTNKFVDGITYDKETKALTYKKGTISTTVGIEGFVTGVTHDAGVLSFTVQGSESPIEINLPKDNFVKSGSYDKTSKKIILILANDDRVEIPAGDLIDDTEFGNTKTVNLNVSKEGMVTADVRVSNEGENKLVVKNDGLYVAPTDLSGKLDKVEKNKANEIIVADANGSVRTSGLKAGRDTLGQDPTADTLATEAAVAAIRTTLQQAIDTKFDKVNISKSVPVVGEASDDRVASEKAVATAINELKNDKIDKTNISTSITDKTVSENKVVSEKAVVAALSWVEL